MNIDAQGVGDLQGTWAGTWTEGGVPGTATVVFTGNMFSFQIEQAGHHSVLSGTFTVDDAFTPRHMDISVTQFPPDQRPWPGIYAIDGTTLRLGFLAGIPPGTPIPRPADFSIANEYFSGSRQK